MRLSKKRSNQTFNIYYLISYICSLDFVKIKIVPLEALLIMTNRKPNSSWPKEFVGSIICKDNVTSVTA